MSDPADDEPVRRGAVPPPPIPDEGPDSVHFPRMEPPPPSLEALVQSRDRSATPEGTSWLVWVVLVALAAVVTGYVLR